MERSCNWMIPTAVSCGSMLADPGQERLVLAERAGVTPATLLAAAGAAAGGRGDPGGGGGDRLARAGV
jgi:hypothetical protein